MASSARAFVLLALCVSLGCVYAQPPPAPGPILGPQFPPQSVVGGGFPGGGPSQLSIAYTYEGEMSNRQQIEFRPGVFVPVIWGYWGVWGRCQGTCGTGTQKRQRQCFAYVVEGSYSTYGNLAGQPISQSQLSPQVQSLPQSVIDQLIAASGGIRGCIGQPVQVAPCNLRACATGIWRQWSRWGVCSRNCGGGQQIRSRVCSDSGCTGPRTESRGCNPQECAGVYGAWGRFGPCSAPCGGGTYSRVRVCSGTNCVGPDTDTQSCNVQACAQYAWGLWGSWGRCSVTCGQGEYTRVRACFLGASRSPQVGECLKLGGVASETQNCFAPECITYSYGAWTEWGACDRNCGVGRSRRTRVCLGNGNQAAPRFCQSYGVNTEYQPCDTGVPCEAWGAWGQWGGCNRPCGGGQRSRVRGCFANGVQAYLNACSRIPGESREVEACNVSPCPTWSLWTSWTACSVTCGFGQIQRTRTCTIGGVVQASEDPCKQGRLQSGLQVQNCRGPPCYAWKNWGLWSSCTPACGLRTRTKYRGCTANGVDTLNPADCNRLGVGTNIETENCDRVICYSWRLWGQWSSCSATCGPGTRTKTRVCLADQAPTSVDKCASFDTGSSTAVEPCSGPPCYSWRQWSEWGACAATCGKSSRSRSRACYANDFPTDPSRCSVLGTGTGFESIPCDLDPCYYWKPWSDWTPCPVSCGSGSQSRNRLCYAEDDLVDMMKCDKVENGRSYETIPCNAGPCYYWKPWGDWTPCPVTCGDGTRNRVRDCYGGDDRFEPLKCANLENGLGYETIPCNAGPCYYWKPWSDWTPCPVSCGSGTRNRNRLCYADDDMTDPIKCADFGPGYETIPCDAGPCYYWKPWSDWTPCPVSCGSGTRNRNRLCYAGDDMTDPIKCADFGPGYETIPCDAGPCYYWKPWSEWTPCPVSCGSGTRNRNRFCYAGDEMTDPIKCADFGPGYETIPCDAGPCYYYANWGDWSPCSVTCGRGRSIKTRMCMKGDSPSDDMTKCKGVSFEERVCSGRPCEGTWTTWGEYTECTVPCGGGTKYRLRFCSNDNCRGDGKEDKLCNEQPCLTYGVSVWGEYQPCDATCGQGNEVRFRNCVDNFDRIVDRSLCPANSIYFNSRPCNLAPCYGTYSQWGDWFKCSVDCDGGVQTRRRICSKLPCIGDDEEARACNTQPCVIYFIGSWAQWGTCSEKCDDGVQTRQRECRSSFGESVDATFCGATFSDLFESRPCNQGPCYVPGPWLSWSSCNVQCGDGQQQRIRQCVTTTGEVTDNSKCSDDVEDFFMIITCRKPECPGEYRPWNTWGPCTALCDAGTRTRTRQCSTLRCDGVTKEIEVCNAFACERQTSDSGTWTAWSRWSSCTNPCGGTSKQERKCIGECSGEFLRIRTCTDCEYDIQTGERGSFSSDSCSVNPDDREDCGFAGISPTQCLEKGCCYDSRIPNTEWCFKQAGDSSSKSSSHSSSSSSSSSVTVITQGGKTVVTETETDSSGKTKVTTTTTTDEGSPTLVDENGYGPWSSYSPCDPGCKSPGVVIKPQLRFKLCIDNDKCDVETAQPIIETKNCDDLPNCPDPKSDE